MGARGPGDESVAPGPENSAEMQVQGPGDEKQTQGPGDNAVALEPETFQTVNFCGSGG